MLEDKITSGGEIKEATTFKMKDKSFYLFIFPKTSVELPAILLDAKLYMNDASMEYPFGIGFWNPVLLSEVKITSSTLSSYRVFWGGEY